MVALWLVLRHAHLCLLCRYWVLGGRRDEHFRQRWEQATDEALEQLMVYPKGW